MSKWLLLLVLCCTLATASQPKRAWKPEDIPNPKTHPSACIDLAASKYAPEGEAALESMWVCNPDRILSSATVDAVNEELTNLALTKRSEECKRGTQVGVVVIGKMSGASTEDNARKFAQGVHDSWGVGDSKCNNGAVFILAKEDRKWYISTGAGVKNILTSDAIAHIGTKIQPVLKQSNYNEAVLLAVKEITQILISGEYVPDGWSFFHQNFVDLLVIGFFGLYILYFVICLLVTFGRWVKWYITNYFQRRRQRSEARRALDDMERRFRQGGPAPPHVSITMCPICLEAFPAPLRRPHDAAHHHNDDGASGSGSGNNNNNNNNDEAPNTIDYNNDSTDENAPEILFCGHKFHKKCISDWLSRNDSCPICRRRAPRYSEAPPDSLRQQQVLGADEAFFRFANTRFYYNYSFWTIPSPPRAPPGSIWNLGSGGSGGAASFGGGFSFGGGGGGGSW